MYKHYGHHVRNCIAELKYCIQSIKSDNGPGGIEIQPTIHLQSEPGCLNIVLF
jgi:hypothetical protein